MFGTVCVDVAGVHSSSEAGPNVTGHETPTAQSREKCCLMKNNPPDIGLYITIDHQHPIIPCPHLSFLFCEVGLVTQLDMISADTMALRNCFV